MKKHLFIACLFFCSVGFSQDCINYWKLNEAVNQTYNYSNKYFLVPEGCFSMLISRLEKMEITFEIIQGRDYKLSIGSDLPNGKPIIKVYNVDDNMLMYDNTQNDTASVLEFEVIQSRRVRAIVTLPKSQKENKDRNRYDPAILLPKINRYCVGIKLETMITRK